MKAFAVITLLAGAVSGYSQGQVGWGDYFNSDFQITVWSPQAANLVQVLNGNSPSDFGTGLTSTGPDIPAGTQAGYTGVPLGGSSIGRVSPADYANGNLWSVQLYAAPGVGVPGNLLQPVAGAMANMYTVSDNQGLYDVIGNPVVTIPGVPAGSPATLQLRAWYNGDGAYTSYAAAFFELPTGQSTTGSEDLGSLPGGNPPPDLPGPGNPGVIGGITSFNVYLEPEPSTIALYVIGASAFLMRLRRKLAH